MISDIFGIQIIENPSMVDHHSRIRPWKERLFTWPWRPWVRVAVWQTPSDKIYLVNIDGVGERFTCHPAMAQRIKQAEEGGEG